jgi:hypothetical protein
MYQVHSAAMMAQTAFPDSVTADFKFGGKVIRRCRVLSTTS